MLFTYCIPHGKDRWHGHQKVGDRKGSEKKPICRDCTTYVSTTVNIFTDHHFALQMDGMIFRKWKIYHFLKQFCPSTCK